MKDEEIKINDHVWALMDGKLLIALKKEKGYYVCGDWEGIVDLSFFDTFISVIEKPLSKPLYY